MVLGGFSSALPSFLVLPSSSVSTSSALPSSASTSSALSSSAPLHFLLLVHPGKFGQRLPSCAWSSSPYRPHPSSPRRDRPRRRRRPGCHPRPRRSGELEEGGDTRKMEDLRRWASLLLGAHLDFRRKEAAGIAQYPYWPHVSCLASLHRDSLINPCTKSLE